MYANVCLSPSNHTTLFPSGVFVYCALQMFMVFLLPLKGLLLVNKEYEIQIEHAGGLPNAFG